MLLPKVILLILLLNITDGTNFPNCKEIMEIFYQTEDQFYDLDCTKSQKLESNVTLTYHCRSLQKKMDIFGRKYYDFGVSRTFLIRSNTRIKDRFFNQEWSGSLPYTIQQPRQTHSHGCFQLSSNCATHKQNEGCNK